MTGPILAAERRAFANGLRDPGRRGLLGVAGVVLLGLASGTVWRLTGLFLAWRAAGVLESRLWGVCLLTWAAAGALGALALREQAVGEQARLLFTLPLSPAERARALLVSTATRLVHFWLLSLGGLGTALVLALGVRALPWIALVLLGPALVLGLALGPLAQPLGRFYERAFQALLGASPRPRRRRFVHLLTRGLPPARWVDPDVIHLTLIFLGAIDEAALPTLSAALAAAASAQAPFTLALAGGGTFPPRRPARVAWIGVAAGPGLAALQAAVAAAAAQAVGYEPESRPYNPHITLARCPENWPRPAIETWTAAFAGPVGEPFPVSRAALFESRLSPGGARYRVVEAFPLNGRAGEGAA